MSAPPLRFWVKLFPKKLAGFGAAPHCYPPTLNGIQFRLVVFVAKPREFVSLPMEEKYEVMPKTQLLMD